MNQNNPNLLAAALRYAELGYPIFPCRPGGKEPITEHGLNDATLDEDQICEWWSETPDANIGLRTDGLLVVDVDPLPDGARNEFASDLEQLSDLLVSAGTMTPRGGQHFWFRQPDGIEMRNTTGKIAPGVDTRATGGYVLVPPSVINGTGAYHFMFSFTLEMPPNKLAPPPGWILKALDAEKPSSPKAEPAQPTDNTIPDGQRNQTLTSIAGALRQSGLSESAIVAALRATNSERCKPPLDDAEVRKIAWSVSRYEPDQSAVAVAEGWATQDAEEYERRQSNDPGKLPEHLTSPGGFLGQVIEWNMATAYKPQPELALAAALALLATITGRKICDETGTRTNVYCMGVCESGGGKEHARKVNKAILQAAGLSEMIGPEGIGSHAGILAALNHQPVKLFQVDEFGRLLATLSNPGKAPHLYNVISVLLKLYTSADSLYIGDAVADAKRVAKIDQPHAVLYCTTVPGNFLSSLQKESLSDGFVGRLLVFDANNNDPDSQERPREEVPPEIVQAAAWWGRYQPGGNLAGVNPQPRMLVTSPAAKALYRELELVAKAEAKSGREASTIWTRAVEKARKLAILHQVSADHEATVVSEESAAWGCWLSHHLTARMEFLATDWVAENQYEATLKRLHRTIRAAGDSGIALSELWRKTQFIGGRQRDEILRHLESSGLIHGVKESSGGRPRMVYKATSTETQQRKK